MHQSIPYRRLFALAAVYVVVLQALLLPLAVSAGAVHAEALCLSSGAETPMPAGNETGCPCAAGCGTQCCAQALSGATPGATAYDPEKSWRLSPDFDLEAARQAAVRHPQIPRAPPVS